MQRIQLHGLLPDELVVSLQARGHAVSAADARRLLAWTISQGCRDPSSIRPHLSRAMRQACEQACSLERPAVLERERDPVDGSLRYLLESPDEARSEAVLIPLKAPGRFSACLSTQVGCAVGCRFCATGRLGFSRQLQPWELVASFCTLRDEAEGRVSGAVFMGQGEPFLNYEAVIQAARVLSHPCGGRVDQKRISISTAGIVPALLRYASEGHRYRLVLSLTSALPERRAELMPGVARWSLAELFEALRAVAASCRQRITLAWVLLGGVNHDRAEVEALARLVGDLPVRISLVDVNDARPDGYRRATDAERDEFVDRLQALGAPVVRRYSVGLSSESACGMLAARCAASRGSSSVKGSD